MKEYKTIYLFEAFRELSKGEVFILDRKEREVLHASAMPAGKLSDIMDYSNKDNRFMAWVEVDVKESKDE